MTEITPEMRKIYEQECARGVELFQKSLQEFQKSQSQPQKDQFQDVMEKALQVIRETAPQCLSRALQNQEKELEKDYKDYITNPSPDNLEKLNTDLDHFKKRI